MPVHADQQGKEPDRDFIRQQVIIQLGALGREWGCHLFEDLFCHFGTLLSGLSAFVLAASGAIVPQVPVKFCRSRSKRLGAEGKSPVPSCPKSGGYAIIDKAFAARAGGTLQPALFKGGFARPEKHYGKKRRVI